MMNKAARASQFAGEKIKKVDCSSGLEIKMSPSSIITKIPGSKGAAARMETTSVQTVTKHSANPVTLPVISKLFTWVRGGCPQCNQVFTNPVVLTSSATLPR